MIAIVDYGAGNLESVVRAFSKLGEEARITRSAADLDAATRIVLPGVGFFDKAMRLLRESGLAETLQRRVAVERTPLLGICLGFQMLCKHSEEGNAEGFGWLDATVSRMPQAGEKIPHIGWNEPQWQANHPWATGLKPGGCFYFAHSFCVANTPPALTAATCTYGTQFTAAIQQDHLFGIQFHPEKSHENGLCLLKNFLELSRRA